MKKKKKTLKDSDDRSTGASTADKYSAYTHRGGQCECSANKMTMSQMQTGSFKMGLHEAVGDGGHLRSGVWHDWTHEALSYITVSICQVTPCSRVSCHTEGENNPLIGWRWFLEVSLSHLVQSVAKKVFSLVSTMLPWLPVVFPVSLQILAN